MASSLARRAFKAPIYLAIALAPIGAFSLPSCSISPGVCGDARVDKYTDDQKASDPTLVDEECDDGNTIDTDTCTQACRLSACGDGFIQAANNEQCDDTDYGAYWKCDPPCEATQRCDMAAKKCVTLSSDKSKAIDTDGCTPACQLNIVGDGYLNQGVEECDDGNNSDNDACLVTGLAATCGDGFIQTGVEECDDGNDVNIDNCTTECKKAVCGDGYVWAGFEDCDDGNTSNADSCPSCKLPTCGDGFVDPATEECDDGNQFSNDDCLPNCKKAQCGDGILDEGAEECDDGNQLAGDYCSPTCQKECFGPNAGIYEGHCYVYYTGPLGWPQANCNALDAHLVTIESTGENGFVQGLLPADAADAWIGLTDQQVESAWVWQLDQAGQNLQFPALLKWKPGQPDNLPAPAANCAVIDRVSGLWLDNVCAEARGFVCEHDY
ncbi:MAG: DUF4215 domain-containing protein [Polyangiaceae bacterium]